MAIREGSYGVRKTATWQLQCKQETRGEDERLRKELLEAKQRGRRQEAVDANRRSGEETRDGMFINQTNHACLRRVARPRRVDPHSSLLQRVSCRACV